MNHGDSILFILCNAFPSFCADGSHFEIEAFSFLPFLFISDPEYNNNNNKKKTQQKTVRVLSGPQFFSFTMNIGCNEIYIIHTLHWELFCNVFLNNVIYNWVDLPLLCPGHICAKRMQRAIYVFWAADDPVSCFSLIILSWQLAASYFRRPQHHHRLITLPLD